MRIKYQATFFADLSLLSATPENTMALMTQLNAVNAGLLPSTFHELTLPNMSPTARLRFTSTSGDTELLISSGRIDLVRQATILVDAQMEPLATFIEFVERCISSIFQGRSILGTRLALIVQTMNRDLSPDTLNGLFEKFFIAPNFYKQHQPIEWTFRANSRLDLKFREFTESINAILKTERVQGKAVGADGTWQEFDSVMSEFDINTSPLNVGPRFPPDAFRAFLEAASPIVDNLEADLSNKLV